MNLLSILIESYVLLFYYLYYPLFLNRKVYKHTFIPRLSQQMITKNLHEHTFNTDSVFSDKEIQPQYFPQ